MKIAFFGILDQEKKDFYKNNLADHELLFFDACLTDSIINQKFDYEIISIFVGCKVTPKTIEAIPNLKFIAIRSTGFDNVDLNYTKQKNILISNVPSYGSHTVAEFTFGLILSLSRKIPEAVYRLKYQKDFDYHDLRGFDLNQKTLGIIGTGKIGTNVIKIAKGFGIKVLAFDLFQNENLAKELEFEYLSLEQLLKQSDIISLHVPYSEKTHHLLNRKNIFMIKNGAFLINTARGGLIETQALFEALTKKHLSGAALDVLEGELELKEDVDLLSENKMPDEQFKNLLENHILINLDKVLVTPHMAFYTKEAEEAIMQTTVENINKFLENNPQNLVN
ncbi:hydroxyacid dehydrogenase [Candidatus Daviesbacteria bacterium]|nr:hydroxyacid dehydrogenase [Candidatus Daviesbacteria bacterium]